MSPFLGDHYFSPITYLLESAYFFLFCLARGRAYLRWSPKPFSLPPTESNAPLSLFSFFFLLRDWRSIFRAWMHPLVLPFPLPFTARRKCSAKDPGPPSFSRALSEAGSDCFFLFFLPPLHVKCRLSPRSSKKCRTGVCSFSLPPFFSQPALQTRRATAPIQGPSFFFPFPPEFRPAYPKYFFFFSFVPSVRKNVMR